MAKEYPKMISDLPEVELPIAGVSGRLVQGASQQVVFFDIDPVGEIPRHSHGDQFGVVIEGQMELTIGDQTRTYGPGDEYFIPAGVEHGATFKTRVRLIDVFADVDRYQTKL